MSFCRWVIYISAFVYFVSSCHVYISPSHTLYPIVFFYRCFSKCNTCRTTGSSYPVPDGLHDLCRLSITQPIFHSLQLTELLGLVGFKCRHCGGWRAVQCNRCAGVGAHVRWQAICQECGASLCVNSINSLKQKDFASTTVTKYEEGSTNWAYLNCLTCAKVQFIALCEKLGSKMFRHTRVY